MYSKKEKIREKSEEKQEYRQRIKVSVHNQETEVVSNILKEAKVARY